MYRTQVSQVIKRYGQPTHKRNTAERDVPVAGTRDYIWERKDLRLLVSTHYHKDQETGIYNVEVWGRLGITGRGLRIGSTLQQQRAVYGDRFFVSSAGKGRVKSVVLQREDGSQLTIDYGPDERVAHTQLIA